MIYQHNEQTIDYDDDDTEEDDPLSEKKEEQCYESEWKIVYQQMKDYTEFDSMIYGKTIDYYKEQNVKYPNLIFYFSIYIYIYHMDPIT